MAAAAMPWETWPRTRCRAIGGSGRYARTVPSVSRNIFTVAYGLWCLFLTVYYQHVCGRYACAMCGHKRDA
eukprot:1285159-Prymnesium_polylepis.1